MYFNSQILKFENVIIVVHYIFIHFNRHSLKVISIYQSKIIFLSFAALYTKQNFAFLYSIVNKKQNMFILRTVFVFNI